MRRETHGDAAPPRDPPGACYWRLPSVGEGLDEAYADKKRTESEPEYELRYYQRTQPGAILRACARVSVGVFDCEYETNRRCCCTALLPCVPVGSR